MLTGSTPGGGELPILSPNAVLGVGPCPQPRTVRGRALKSGDSYGEGERLKTPRRLNYGTAQDPLPICEEEELTGTKTTIRTAVQRDRSSNRVNLHDGLYTVYLRETEKRNSHRPEDSKTTTEGLEDGKEGSRRGSDALRFRQTLAIPRFSSSGLTDARLAVVKSPASRRSPEEKSISEQMERRRIGERGKREEEEEAGVAKKTRTTSLPSISSTGLEPRCWRR
ncbi:hypothetical protein F2Q68_00003609 [Brassica cretica]|uniref:Uncharacterized protein n=1 Tax=Brassica cretica TaxID=69181 RepID=A0A8S9JGG0_BRACR|nr:hypothetical protein F2Q68_00003609 [Brassica cretica]